MVLELRTAIKYLRSECTRLRAQVSANSLFDLSVLNTGNTLWSESNSDLSTSHLQIVDLNKELNQLVKETRLKCATATVVPLSKNQQTANSLLHLKKEELQNLANKIQSTKSKIQSTLSPQITSDFATFAPTVQVFRKSM
jgi:hypothetical protein